MGQIWQFGDQQLLCAKGAYESILPLCRLAPELEQQIAEQANAYAKQGFRVLAVAKRENVSEIPEELEDNQLTFAGLVALVDPPRAGVKASVEACHHAGVRIIMITGDNGETATGVARQIGLNHLSLIHI